MSGGSGPRLLILCHKSRHVFYNIKFNLKPRLFGVTAVFFYYKVATANKILQNNRINCTNNVSVVYEVGHFHLRWIGLQKPQVSMLGRRKLNHEFIQVIVLQNVLVESEQN